MLNNTTPQASLFECAKDELYPPHPIDLFTDVLNQYQKLGVLNIVQDVNSSDLLQMCDDVVMSLSVAYGESLSCDVLSVDLIACIEDTREEVINAGAGDKDDDSFISVIKCLDDQRSFLENLTFTKPMLMILIPTGEAVMGSSVGIGAFVCENDSFEKAEAIYHDKMH